MSTLWDKGYHLHTLVQTFTVGNDFVLDQKLIMYDCIGSIAHARMLADIAVISNEEFQQLKRCLQEIIALAQENKFIITPVDEDVHTAVENYLTKKLGDTGKKIHTARSRNDQVALDLRLYMRNEILVVTDKLIALSQKLLNIANETKNVPVPGRTHFQQAMPSSIGLFFAAFAESLLDNITLLQSSYHLIDQSPLGSAAGYGVAMPINRQTVADLLGFSRVQNNVLYVSNSRGKFEAVVLNALTQIMIDLSKLSEDLIILSAPEFGYFEIPKELCSGSSLMPQKKNPDLLELVRAKSATTISSLMQTLMIVRTLPSGYNRDFQETKQPLMDSFTTAQQSLDIIFLAINNIKVHQESCVNAFTNQLFATDYALELVQQGHSFRDAYKIAALNAVSIQTQNPYKNIAQKTHQGAPGNLNLELSYAACLSYASWAHDQRKTIEQALQKLLK